MRNENIRIYKQGKTISINIKSPFSLMHLEGHNEYRKQEISVFSVYTSEYMSKTLASTARIWLSNQQVFCYHYTRNFKLCQKIVGGPKSNNY